MFSIQGTGSRLNAFSNALPTPTTLLPRNVGHTLAEDSERNPLPLFRFDGVIPEGKLFVVGHHPRSWDSRYFGFVDVEEVLNRAYPLF